MLIVVVIIGILAAALIPRLQSVQARARDTKRKADLHQIGTALAIYKEDNWNFDKFIPNDVGNLTRPINETKWLKQVLVWFGQTSPTDLIPYAFPGNTIARYMTSIPTDSDDTQRRPNGQRTVWYGIGILPQHGIWMDQTQPEKALNAFIIFTRTETIGWANRVSDSQKIGIGGTSICEATWWPGAWASCNVAGEYDANRVGALWGYWSLSNTADGYIQRQCTTIELSGTTLNNESWSCAANKDSDDLRYIYVN